jgi:hypothetical protein
MLPVAAKRDLARHIERMRARHARDLAHGAGWVELPWARARKYPDAGREWGCRWVFPATRFDVDRAIGQHRRHHLHESVLQRAVREAVLKAGIVKRQPATPSGIRSRPTCWRTATTSAPFKSLGHRDVSTTMIDTHVLNRGPAAVQSPATDVPDLSHLRQIAPLHCAATQDIKTAFRQQPQHRFACLRTFRAGGCRTSVPAILRRAPCSPCYVVQESVGPQGETDELANLAIFWPECGTRWSWRRRRRGLSGLCQPTAGKCGTPWNGTCGTSRPG